MYYQKLIIEGGYSVPGSMAQLSFNRKIILKYLGKINLIIYLHRNLSNSLSHVPFCKT